MSIALAFACYWVTLGVFILRGWKPALYPRQRRAGWGAITLGSGAVLYALPSLLGSSDRTHLGLIGALCIVLPASVAFVGGGQFAGGRRRRTRP